MKIIASKLMVWKVFLCVSIPPERQIYILIIFLFCVITIKGQTSGNNLPDSFYKNVCRCEGMYLDPFWVGTDFVATVI